MKIKNKINNINTDKSKRIEFIKIEIKKIIYKSIIQNLNIKPNIRSNTIKKLLKLNKNCFISKQKNNLCLKSGRFKGVLKKTNIGRHELKKLGLKNFLQNIKISSW